MVADVSVACCPVTAPIFQRPMNPVRSYLPSALRILVHMTAQTGVRACMHRWIRGRGAAAGGRPPRMRVRIPFQCTSVAPSRSLTPSHQTQALVGEDCCPGDSSFTGPTDADRVYLERLAELDLLDCDGLALKLEGTKQPDFDGDLLIHRADSGTKTVDSEPNKGYPSYSLFVGMLLRTHHSLVEMLHQELSGFIYCVTRNEHGCVSISCSTCGDRRTRSMHAGVGATPPACSAGATLNFEEHLNLWRLSDLRTGHDHTPPVVLTAGGLSIFNRIHGIPIDAITRLENHFLDLQGTGTMAIRVKSRVIKDFMTNNELGSLTDVVARNLQRRIQAYVRTLSGDSDTKTVQTAARDLEAVANGDERLGPCLHLRRTASSELEGFSFFLPCVGELFRRFGGKDGHMQIDATFGKVGSFPVTIHVTLLVGFQRHLSIGFYHCEAETTNAYIGALRELVHQVSRQLDMDDHDAVQLYFSNLVVMSDSAPAIAAALKTVLPCIRHRLCLRHKEKNLRRALVGTSTEYKNAVIASFYRLVRTTTAKEWNEGCAALRLTCSDNTRVSSFVDAAVIQKHKELALFELDGYVHHRIATSNMVEGLSSALRRTWSSRKVRRFDVAKQVRLFQHHAQDRLEKLHASSSASLASMRKFQVGSSAHTMSLVDPRLRRVLRDVTQLATAGVGAIAAVRVSNVPNTADAKVTLTYASGATCVVFLPSRISTRPASCSLCHRPQHCGRPCPHLLIAVMHVEGVALTGAVRLQDVHLRFRADYIAGALAAVLHLPAAANSGISSSSSGITTLSAARSTMAPSTGNSSGGLPRARLLPLGANDVDTFRREARRFANNCSLLREHVSKRPPDRLERTFRSTLDAMATMNNEMEGIRAGELRTLTTTIVDAVSGKTRGPEPAYAQYMHGKNGAREARRVRRVASAPEQRRMRRAWRDWEEHGRQLPTTRPESSIAPNVAQADVEKLRSDVQELHMRLLLNRDKLGDSWDATERAMNAVFNSVSKVRTSLGRVVASKDDSAPSRKRARRTAAASHAVMVETLPTAVAHSRQETSARNARPAGTVVVVVASQQDAANGEEFWLAVLRQSTPWTTPKGSLVPIQWYESDGVHSGHHIFKLQRRHNDIPYGALMDMVFNYTDVDPSRISLSTCEEENIIALVRNNNDRVKRLRCN